MTYDMNFWLTQTQFQSNQIPAVALRKKLALDVLKTGDAEAKKKARDCTIPIHHEFRYRSPGEEQPFLNTGIAFQFSWRLKTPFFSRSENFIDAVDNPISRDYLSNHPILKASGAKGMLSSIIRMQDPALAEELFGIANSSIDESGIKGMLIIGDMVFSDISHDTFSPHDRRFGVVDHPVGFEVVPAGTKGEWGIMVPSLANKNRREQLVFLLKAIQALLCTYGASAKRSAGYGIAEKDIKVTCRVGKNIILPETFKILGGNAFSEPEPDKSGVPDQMPEKFDVLVKKNSDGIPRMACTREEAYQTLYDSEFKTSKKGLDKKALKRLGKKKQNFKTKWEKMALTRWDKCKKIIDKMADQSPEKIARRQKAVEEWKIRRKHHEENRPVYYQLTLEQTIDMVCNNMEVR